MKRTINQTAKRSLKTKKAFTLVELLVVIAIIGILFVVLISKVDFATDKAKTAGVQTDFRSYQMAMKVVGMEQQGFTNNMDDLAAQLNKNLDPKLQVAVVDGQLTTEAEDPWGTAYQFTYGEPANTRGEIVVRSAGPDLQYNTDDDIIIVSRYEFGANGGGVVEATESINPLVLYAVPGLYDPDTGKLVKTWDELVEEGHFIVNGTQIWGNTVQSCTFEDLNGTLVIKEGITSVSNGTFFNEAYTEYRATGITRVVLPESLTTFGGDGLDNVEEIIIKSNVISSMYTTQPVPVYVLCDTVQEIGLEVFKNHQVKKINIPGSVTSIGESAFYNCTSLESITISEGVAVIGTRAFYNCTSLTSINLPNSVTEIGEGAFSGCTSLSSINIPSNVTVIATSAFEGCSSLSGKQKDGILYVDNWAIKRTDNSASATLSADTKGICGGMFYCNYSLRTITCLSVTPPIVENSFLGDYSVTDIYVPAESVNAYKAAAGWSEYASLIKPIQ